MLGTVLDPRFDPLRVAVFDTSASRRDRAGTRRAAGAVAHHGRSPRLRRRAHIALDAQRAGAGGLGAGRVGELLSRAGRRPWTARAVPVHRADFTFIGLPLPAGATRDRPDFQIQRMDTGEADHHRRASLLRGTRWARRWASSSERRRRRAGWLSGRSSSSRRTTSGRTSAGSSSTVLAQDGAARGARRRRRLAGRHRARSSTRSRRRTRGSICSHGPRKMGLGTAYIAGFRWALERDYDYVFEMDADFSHDPAHLPQFLAADRATPTSCSARATSRGRSRW